MIDGLRPLLLACTDGEDGDGSDRTDEAAVSELTDAKTQAEFSHELYIDSTNLSAALTGCSATRSLEVGCGYGRLTPWITQATAEHHAVDLSRPLLEAARREYPDVRFQCAQAESLPFLDDVFDLAVTWGVLNHVPSESIDTATDEIERVVAPEGTLVISEATDGNPDPRWVYRSLEEWCALFSSRELAWHAHTERDEEPFRDSEREHVVMRFR
jgi:SAM-dependent methyltransferase